jgi:hypothetical protein
VAADLPQAATARPEEVVDPTITNRLRDRGFLRQLGQQAAVPDLMLSNPMARC